MKREDIMSVFREIKNYKNNFIIETNNFCYYAKFESNDGSCYIKDVGFYENSLRFTYVDGYKYDANRIRGEHIIVLPYDKIVAIEIILKGLNSCYPSKASVKINN